MPIIAKAACWAFAIMLLAIANIIGLVEDDVANTLFVILPLVAVMTARGRQTCAPRHAPGA